MRDLLQIPNLISLSRIFLTPLVGYFLWKNDNQSTLVCIVLLIIAGITDGLDGWLARKLNKVSSLGIALDPVADKIFAGVLVVLLVLYRGMPVWLAGVILGRDLLILLAGFIILKNRKITIPSNLTGKYTYTAIVILLASYVLRFEFGIRIYTWVTLLFTLLSLINYSRVFIFVSRGLPAPVFKDRRFYRTGRIVVTLVFIVITLIELFQMFYHG
ncbi:MAG: CDP-alcohol phosphatidyltransferase family protein [Candidatus Zixiibacteriota bacterium]